MTTGRTDALELLLPDADAERAGRARKLITFLRLLASDGHPSATGTILVDLERAREEMDGMLSRGVLACLEELLRHYLRPALGPDTFAWWGEPARPAQEAWSAIEEFRAELNGQVELPAVPFPGESSAAVASRVYGCGGAHGAREGWLLLWGARLERARGGPRAGERALRAALEASAAPPGAAASSGSTGAPLGPADRVAAVAGVAECLLDRGAVRPALAWLEEHLDLVVRSERLSRLDGWVHLLLGAVGEARRTLETLPPWDGPLPLPLAELRRRRAEWLPLLTGREPVRGADSPGPELPGPEFPGPGQGARPPRASEPRVRDRLELGAAVLGVFALAPGCATRRVLLDVAPALRDRALPWLAERDGCCAVPAQLEHRMVVEARPVVVNRAERSAPGGAGEPLRGALAEDTALALALVPVLDRAGEVSGWMHLECEHHLLPSIPRLQRLAAAWDEPVAESARGEASPAPEGGLEHGADPCEPPPPGAAPGPPVGAPPLLELPRRVPANEVTAARAETLRALVRSFDMKTVMRRWWGFVVEDEEPLLLVEEGGALADWHRVPGGHRALARALKTGGVVCFDEPDRGLSLHGESSSGLVVPLRASGHNAAERVCALLAVESIRRRDFRREDLVRFAERARPLGPAFRLAQFRDWHRARFGFDVYFDAAGEGFGACVADFVVAGRSRSPVVLTGPAGSGKQILARWLHFESERPGGPIEVFPCGALPVETAAGRLFGPWSAPAERPGGLFAKAAGGTLVLDDVDRLGAPLQVRLLELLEEADSRRAAAAGGGAPPRGEPPRLVATSRMSLDEAVASGALRQDLAQRLDRLQLFVPALSERRDEIPAMALLLARRFAEEEGLRAPSFPDETLGLFWRQSWSGNVRQLENLVYKLVLLHPGEPVPPEAVIELARRFRLQVLRRLPSRHPQPADLRAALRATRKRSGAYNKTRAALYLGWDPDTLVARMRDLNL